MAEDYEIHVISNTHWDREWLYDFRETRMMLVEFFDRLLEVFDKEPGFTSYVLDSQTVPLEDYLEVRPEKREKLAEYVRSGRLLVGPWYTDPEGFTVNGESLVRNLLYGHRVARQFGKVMKVGHTPFSYGQNSQMPQIYSGFGIDTMLFYHGVSHDDTPNEFIFEGADGTRILGSQMSSGARYNFYQNVYRRVLYGAGIDDREYEWTQGGLPFRLCGESHMLDHHFLLDPRTEFHKEYIKEAVLNLSEAEQHVATTKYLAFMDGHDASVPNAAVVRIIEEAQRILGKDKIFHYNLEDHMAKVKGAVRDLPVLRGERRVPKPMGARVHLYSDVLSCRTRMKRANALAEQALQRLAEPFAALAWRLGAEYPGTQLDMAWKLLLKGHAHDSISGTGVDDIERDMLHRIRQVVNISRGLFTRSLQHIQLQIDNSDAGGDDVLLTVFNPSPWRRREVVTAAVDLPATSGYHAISVWDAERNEQAPMQLVSRRPHHAVVNHSLDATAMMTCDQAVVRFEADVPPMGYATYTLARQAAAGGGGLVCGQNEMRNEHLHVAINSDGTLRLTHTETGRQVDGLLYYEDGGEAGHAWMHIEPAHDSIVTTLGALARVSLEEDGPLLARYRIEHVLNVPARLEENRGDDWQRLDGAPNASRRSTETRPLPIATLVTLKKDAAAVEVAVTFNNTCDDHRLRVLFPTNLDTNTCSVETAFDVVERPIEPAAGEPWADAPGATFPMQRFIDLTDGSFGLAVINDGLREYEVTRDGRRAVAVTLLRAFEVALTTVSKRWERHPEMGLSQAHGPHEFRFLLYPHAGGWVAADVPRLAEQLALPLQPAQTGPHTGSLPRRHSLLEISPSNLVLSALKLAENGAGLTLRVYNPTSDQIAGSVTFLEHVKSTRLVTLEELPAGELNWRGGKIEISALPKKILTIEAAFE